MTKVPITRYGHHRLLRELAYLRREVRPQVLEDLREARAFGVKIDNQQYLLARERHLVLERQIQDLEDKLSRSEVFAGRKYRSKQVAFAATALIQNVHTGEKHTYQLVGPYESDVRNGRISIESPLGSRLMGCREGEEITVVAPAGIRVYRVLAIEN